MNKYIVITNENLEKFPHTWTKGLDYEVVQKVDYFTIASNEGQLNYYNTVREDVLRNFQIVD